MAERVVTVFEDEDEDTKELVGDRVSTERVLSLMIEQDELRLLLRSDVLDDSGTSCQHSGANKSSKSCI